ncbi:MAG: YcbK family protein [Psychromonas sp.]
MPNINFQRRKIITSGIIALGASCLPSLSWAALIKDKPRELNLNNLHTGEVLQSQYFDGKDYQSTELKKLNYICRDFRQNEMIDMDKNLFDQIAAIQQIIGSNAQVQVISGYRSPATNQMLSAKSSAVAKKSHHMLGKALDFRLEGVPLVEVRKAALELKAGGVGYYAKSDFLHIDTAQFRSWG